MTTIETPTIGRIVIYREPSGPDCPKGRDCAAIVTAQVPFGVALTVFPPGGNPYPVDKIPHTSLGVGNPFFGTWHWPERV